MNIDAKISVIIPVYNVEKYLAKCIDSVIAQTHDNLEIMLVNDGSSDSCPQICDAYAKNDNRIKVIHKPNGGISSARNAGLDIATGEWIGFVDSDDWVLPNMYEELISAAVNENSDLAVCGYIRVDENGEHLKYISVYGKVLTNAEALTNLVVSGGAYNVAWSKLYKKSILEGIRFPVGKIHEDVFVTNRIFCKCNKVAIVPSHLYMYVKREGSIMTSSYSIERLHACDAFFERYFMLKEKGMTKLANLTARKIGMCLIDALKYLDYVEHKRKIDFLYKNVFWKLFAACDLRVLLLLYYRLKVQFFK